MENMKLSNQREDKKIQRKLIRYVNKRISDMPKGYKEAPTYAIHGAEALGIIGVLESKIKHN